jgi:hypothetical protein
MKKLNPLCFDDLELFLLCLLLLRFGVNLFGLLCTRESYMAIHRHDVGVSLDEQGAEKRIQDEPICQ